MSQYDYDLYVIGAGSGGVRAARMSASMGAKVAIAEERYLGGTCVNVGCVPKKLFVYASQFSEAFVDSQGYGWQVPDQIRFEWSQLRAHKDQEIHRLNGVYQRLLEGAGVQIHNGRARVTGPNSVEINGQTYRAQHILIATGGWPAIPEFPGSEFALNSNDLFYLESLPNSAMVVGGGYIAVEFAGILNGLGVDTQLVYRGEQILRGFDRQMRDLAAVEIRKKGVLIRLNEEIREIRTNQDGGYRVELISGEHCTVGMVLFATGRNPMVQGIGLEELGVALNEAGEIQVDSFYRTNVPSIFALGDVTPGPKLTPVALAEGMTLAKHLFQGSQETLNYSDIPTAVFCQPNLATVGLTEEEARAQIGEIQVYETAFKPMKHSLSGRDERTFMKLIVSSRDDRVVGAHMMGPDAGEIIQGIAVAIRAGATKRQFDTTIGIHPTAAEEFVTLRQVAR